MNNNNGKFRTRKFVITMVVISLAFIALLISKLDGDQFVSLVIWAVGIFSSANVAAKHKQFTEGS